MATRFKNVEFDKIHTRLVQYSEALRNAVRDQSQGPSNQAIYHLDFSTIFPTTTPRNNRIPDPRHGEFDFLSYSVLKNIRGYRAQVGFKLAISPLPVLELIDQLDHRAIALESVFEARTPELMYDALRRTLKNAPATEDEFLRFVGGSIHAMTVGETPRRGVEEFTALYADKTIIPLLTTVDPEVLNRAFADKDSFDQIYTIIDKFRRPGDGDPADHEFHKIVDVLMLLISKHSLDLLPNRPIYYVGQEKLRRVFGGRSETYSRAITSAAITLASFIEVPSHTDLFAEVKYNLELRLSSINKDMSELDKFHDSDTLPLGLAKKIDNDLLIIDQLLFGGAKMVSREEINEIVGRIAGRPDHIRDVFKQAGEENKNSQVLVSKIAQGIINDEFREALALHPNERVARLFRIIESKP